MRCKTLWQCGLILLLWGWISVSAAGLPSRTVEGIDYLSHEGAAAVEIEFSGPVQYLSHFPLERGASVEIFIGPRNMVDPEVDTLPFVQALRAPKSDTIPLSQITFNIDAAGVASLTASFDRVVRFTVMGGGSPNAIMIVLPDIAAGADLAVAALMAEKPIASTAGDSLEKMMNDGREALKNGNNARAIQVFTRLLSMPPHKYSQPALEFLGVARERNGQEAHAKALYQEYLKQYPKSEDAVRVKQRLDELISGQITPKMRLKEEKRAEDKAMESDFYGSISQYYYRGLTETEQVGSIVDESTLLSQLSLNWRLRNKEYDIRNVFYATHSRDFLGGVSEPVTVDTAYSQIKNNRLNFTGKVGRQSGQGGGVLGKFDGAKATYGLSRNLSISGVMGYPVDISDKNSLQTEQPFFGVGFELDREGKGIDILPYFIRQQVDGIVDREAVGSEFRYFHPKGNFYSLVDYDISYSDLNIYMFRGQYNWRTDTVLNFNLDFRNNPLLFTTDALIGRTEESVADLLNTLSEQQVRDLAEARVGNSASFSTGISHTFNPQYQLSADITKAVQVYVLDDTTSGLVSEVEQQTYLYVQLVANKWFNDRDTTVLGVRLSQTSSYDELSLSGSNRLPLGKLWRVDSRLRLDMRQNDAGEEITKLRPSVKLDHNLNKQWHFESELGVEMWRYGGDSNNPNYTRLFGNLGYRWSF